MAEITIVLSPPGRPEAEHVRDVLTQWAAAGFVRPVLWWEDRTPDGHVATWTGGERVALLDELAARPYERVSLVSLVPVVDGEGPKDVPELFDDVESIVAQRLGPAQRLSTVGVVAPATGVADVPRSVLAHRWHTAVVAVDEDGRNARHTSREVRDETHHAAHAALALATVAGIWTGMAGAPFAEDLRAAGHQDQRVRLVRGYARAVRGHGLIREILRTTLLRKQNPEWMAQLVDAEPALDPDVLADRAVTEFLNGPAVRLRWTPFTAPLRRRMRVDPRMALRMLWLFVRGRLREIPDELRYRISEDARDRMERFVQRVTFGDDSTFVVRFDDSPLTDTEHLPHLDVTAGAVELAEALVAAVGRPAVPRRFTAEWQALRALCFGLADAGPLPQRCTAPVSGNHRLVLPAGSVCPRPAGSETSLPDWLASAPDTVLSRVGRRVFGDADQAQNAFFAALKRLRNAKPGVPEGGEPNRLLWWIWLAISAVTGLGFVSVLVLRTWGMLGWRPALLIAIGCVLVFLGASAVLGFLHLRREFQEAYRVNRMLAEYQDARAAAEHEAEELVRLAAACAEYEDWAGITASVVHHAAGAGDGDRADPVDLAALSRPSALLVARAETDQALLARLASIAGQRCFPVGWITQLYTRVTAELMTGLRFERGLAENDPPPDPDTDAIARRLVRDEVRKGAADRLLVADIRAVVLAQAPDLALADLFSRVCPVDEPPLPVADFLTGLLTPETAGTPFHRRVWHSSSGYPVVATTTRTWLPAPLATESPQATPLEVNLASCLEEAVLLAARLDYTPPVPWSDLALFQQATIEEDQQTEVFPDDIG